MNDKDLKDKAVFIIGLLAIFLTLTTFRQSFSKITVPLGTSQTQILTIWNLVVFLVSTLMASVYLFALSYMRFSFGKYQKNKYVKWFFQVIIFLANFFYSIALILPLIIIIMSLFITSPLGQFSKQHQLALVIFDGVGIAIIAIAGGFNAVFLSKKEVLND